MDKRSFEQLYMDLLPGLYRLAQSILRNSSDAQDAVHQAVVKAWGVRDRIDTANARAYISRIVINESRNIQRRRMRETAVAEAPERGYMRPDMELRWAIERLPEKMRTPILLRYMEGYSEKEAASALRIPLSALKSRLFRARRQLEKFLKEEVELQ